MTSLRLKVSAGRISEGETYHYEDAGIAVTNLEIGPEIADVSDSDIVEVPNQGFRNDAKQATEYKHVVFEVPFGSAQIEYFARCDQWVPRTCRASTIDCSASRID